VQTLVLIYSPYPSSTNAIWTSFAVPSFAVPSFAVRRHPPERLTGAGLYAATRELRLSAADRAPKLERDVLCGLCLTLMHNFEAGEAPSWIWGLGQFCEQFCQD
jgi:hypothetical protein